MIPRLLRHTLTLAAGSAGSALLALVLSIVIGRAAGEDGLGVYAASLAWIFPLALVVDFGVGTLITRDLARPDARHSPRDVLRAALLARLIPGGVIVAAVWIGAPLLAGDPRVADGLRVSSPLLIISPLYGTLTALLRARGEMAPIALLGVVMLVIQLALTPWALAAGGVLLALAVNTATSAGQLIAAYGVVRSRLPASDWKRRSPVPVRGLLRRALPFALAAVLAALQLRAATILLERLTDPAQVGYYTAAARFVEGGRLLVLAFFDALLPALSSLAVDRERLRATFRRATLGVVAGGALFGLGALLVAGPLIDLTYGADFAPAAAVLPVLAWSLLLTALKYARGLYWYALGAERRVIAVTAVALIAQVALGLLVIPMHGALGAAWIMLAVEGLALALLWR